jgi:hypothetical protein
MARQRRKVDKILTEEFLEEFGGQRYKDNPDKYLLRMVGYIDPYFLKKKIQRLELFQMNGTAKRHWSV